MTSLLKYKQLLNSLKPKQQHFDFHFDDKKCLSKSQINYRDNKNNNRNINPNHNKYLNNKINNSININRSKINYNSKNKIKKSVRINKNSKIVKNLHPISIIQSNICENPLYQNIYYNEGKLNISQNINPSDLIKIKNYKIYNNCNINKNIKSSNNSNRKANIYKNKNDFNDKNNNKNNNKNNINYNNNYNNAKCTYDNKLNKQECSLHNKKYPKLYIQPFYSGNYKLNNCDNNSKKLSNDFDLSSNNFNKTFCINKKYYIKDEYFPQSYKVTYENNSSFFSDYRNKSEKALNKNIFGETSFENLSLKNKKWKEPLENKQYKDNDLTKTLLKVNLNSYGMNSNTKRKDINNYVNLLKNNKRNYSAISTNYTTYDDYNYKNKYKQALERLNFTKTNIKQDNNIQNNKKNSVNISNSLMIKNNHNIDNNYNSNFNSISATNELQLNCNKINSFNEQSNIINNNNKLKKIVVKLKRENKILKDKLIKSNKKIYNLENQISELKDKNSPCPNIKEIKYNNINDYCSKDKYNCYSNINKTQIKNINFNNKSNSPRNRKFEKKTIKYFNTDIPIADAGVEKCNHDSSLIERIISKIAHSNYRTNHTTKQIKNKKGNMETKIKKEYENQIEKYKHNLYKDKEKEESDSQTNSKNVVLYNVIINSGVDEPNSFLMEKPVSIDELSISESINGKIF